LGCLIPHRRELDLYSDADPERRTEERTLSLIITTRGELFWAAYVGDDDIRDCYMEITQEGRMLCVAGVAFGVTAEEFEQIAAVFSPLGLAVFNGPAPLDDDDEDDDDPEAS
jgi:hypothetical protein